jgi:hypothetical protein
LKFKPELELKFWSAFPSPVCVPITGPSLCHHYRAPPRCHHPPAIVPDPRLDRAVLPDHLTVDPHLNYVLAPRASLRRVTSPWIAISGERHPLLWFKINAPLLHGPPQPAAPPPRATACWIWPPPSPESQDSTPSHVSHLAMAHQPEWLGQCGLGWLVRA